VLLQYLQDLECPLPLSADDRQAVLQWMLSFAVSLEYADHGEGCSSLAKWWHIMVMKLWLQAGMHEVLMITSQYWHVHSGLHT
jgi:hypothetical protein